MVRHQIIEAAEGWCILGSSVQGAEKRGIKHHNCTLEVELFHRCHQHGHVRTDYTQLEIGMI